MLCIHVNNNDDYDDDNNDNIITIIIIINDGGGVCPLRGCDHAERKELFIVCHFVVISIRGYPSSGRLPSSIILLSFIREITLATRVYVSRPTRRLTPIDEPDEIDFRRTPVPFLLPFDSYWFRCCCCCWFSNNFKRRNRDPSQLFLPSIPSRRAIFVDMSAGAIPSRLPDATKFARRQRRAFHRVDRQNTRSILLSFAPGKILGKNFRKRDLATISMYQIIVERSDRSCTES